MIFLRAQVYAENKRRLKAALIEAAASFCKEFHLKKISTMGMKSIDAEVEEVSEKMLWHGMDIWPDSIAEDDHDKAGKTPSPDLSARKIDRSTLGVCFLAACVASMLVAHSTSPTVDYMSVGKHHAMHLGL